MKFKDFARKQFTTANVLSQDVEAVLSSSAFADLEIPDDVADKYFKAVLTREAAKNDTELVTDIRKHMRKELFTNFDTRLEPLYDLIDKDDADKIRPEFETYKRMEMLGEALKKNLAVKKGKTDTEIQKTEADWAAKLKAQEEREKTGIESLKKDFKQKNITNALKAKINGYQFADAHKPLKDTIATVLIQSLSSKVLSDGTQVVLDEDENGVVHVRKNVEGTLKDVYNGNDKVTVDNLLDQLVDPYIVKSNGTTTTTTQPGPKTSARPAMKSGMTLEEERLAQFAAAAD